MTQYVVLPIFGRNIHHSAMQERGQEVAGMIIEG